MSYRIYVACLASYNNGKLHGQWIDASDSDDMLEATQKMLENSPEEDAEEWAIHDYELPFSIGEYEDFESIANRVEWIENQYDEELAAKVLEDRNGDVSEAESLMEGYMGAYDTLADLGESYADDTGVEIPSRLECYIDWTAYGRDIAMNMTAIESGGTTHYFSDY